MESGDRRIVNTWLHDGSTLYRGDVILHMDGGWSPSNGDEDVIDIIDGSSKFITRSFKIGIRTYDAQQGYGEGLDLMSWLNTSIFPTEKRITRELVKLEPGLLPRNDFHRDHFRMRYAHFPGSIGPVLADAGIGVSFVGPPPEWPPKENAIDDGSTLKS